MSLKRMKTIILGAAGRDFHNFNTFWRDRDSSEVIAFTAAQIPDIDGRTYPPELCGPLYPNGIRIEPEEKLVELIQDNGVGEVVMAYSDLPFAEVMHKAAIVNAAGADFRIMGHRHTMLKSTKPVIAVCAVRTGCGKSQTSRRIIEILMEKGTKVVAIRHPMPYGDLGAQRVQRFAEIEDLAKHNCTIEEMEEYEPHIVRGNVIYAGVDYQAILDEAENDPRGCDIIVWDGGNNDFPFYVPDLHVTVVDPHRPGHELSYYPGEITLRLADVVVVNKMDSADPTGVATVLENIATVNPEAIVIKADSVLEMEDPTLVKGKMVLVVEDGPTLTHGGMKIGAGVVAAQRCGAQGFVDPRPFAVGTLAEVFETYPEVGTLLPAMGYGEQQLKDLETTINNTECDVVVIGTPIDLNRIIDIKQPNTRVFYNLKEISHPDLSEVIDTFLAKHNL